MRALILAVLLLAAAPSWPNTPAGAMAKQYVDAFASEQAMRAFLLRNPTDRSTDERLATYRESKKKFVTLQLASVVSSKPSQLVAKLVSKDGKSYEFTFNVEPAPPHKLVSITRVEQRMEGHGHGIFGWLPGH